MCICISGALTEVNSLIHSHGHPILHSVILLTKHIIFKQAELPSLAFKKIDYANLNAFFLTTDMSELYAHDSLEEKISYFYETVHTHIGFPMS